MLADVGAAAFWVAIGKVVWIDILLSGDNAVVIALAARKLSPERQRQAIVLGGLGAIGLRIVLIFFAVALLELPWLKLIGAVLLVWIGIQLMKGEVKGARGDRARHPGNLIAAVRTILVADLIMSLDNVVAVAAVAETAPPQLRLPVLVVGLGLTIPLILFGSRLLLELMERFPVIVAAGAALLGFVAGEMAATEPVLGRFEIDQGWRPYALGGALATAVVAVGGLMRPRRVEGA